MPNQMDLFLEALASHRYTLTADDFVVEQHADGCQVTLNAGVLDAVALEVATMANNLVLTAITHTSDDAPHGTDPADYRGHRVDITFPKGT